MADITCDCAGELAIAPFPCKSTDYGYASKLLLLPPTGTLEVAGETPTLAEIQAAIAESGENRMVVIEEITNGQRNVGDVEEETGADTADGLTNTFGVNMVLTGRVKLVDEAVRANLEALNCYSRLKMWFITNKGYIFGGATGYRVSNFIKPMILEGFGTRAYYDINQVYSHNLNATDPAGYDAGFTSLVNPETT